MSRRLTSYSGTNAGSHAHQHGDQGEDQQRDRRGPAGPAAQAGEPEAEQRSDVGGGAQRLGGGRAEADRAPCATPASGAGGA